MAYVSKKASVLKYQEVRGVQIRYGRKPGSRRRPDPIWFLTSQTTEVLKLVLRKRPSITTWQRIRIVLQLRAIMASASENGGGFELDLHEAAKYYKLTAAQNTAEALLNCGICLETGDGVGINLVEAAKSYKLAAGQNDPLREFQYGFCVERSTECIGLL
jgi:hypothetical protein